MRIQLNPLYLANRLSSSKHLGMSTQISRLAFFLCPAMVLTPALWACSKGQPRLTSPSKPQPKEQKAIRRSGQNKALNETPKQPPGGLELDQEPVHVDSLLKPSSGKKCYSDKECKVVINNCSGKCKCVALPSYAPEPYCEDGPTCPDKFCRRQFPFCTDSKRGGECWVGMVQFNEPGLGSRDRLTLRSE